jgi:hypothetical protein
MDTGGGEGSEEGEDRLGGEGGIKGTSLCLEDRLSIDKHRSIAMKKPARLPIPQCKVWWFNREGA